MRQIYKSFKAEKKVSYPEYVRGQLVYSVSASMIAVTLEISGSSDRTLRLMMLTGISVGETALCDKSYWKVIEGDITIHCEA